jgi:hypothetical protein
VSSSKEFLKQIPNFNIVPDSGGDLVNVVNGYNEIGWEAYTSKKEVSFSLVADGFKALFHQLGVGAKYDSEGELNIVRIDVQTFLTGLLSEAIDKDENNLEELYRLLEALQENDEKLVAHLNLGNGQCCVYGNNANSGNSRMVAIDEIDDFDEFAMLSVAREGITFEITFLRYESDFGVGIGMLYEDRLPSDEPSPYGRLPNDKDDDETEDDGDGVTFLLTRFFSTECNYWTFLDSKRANRFDLLAKKITYTANG